MEKVLLSTRLRMPRPRKNYIVREELHRKLSSSAANKLTIIKGGAGCGKTTLTLSYIHENLKAEEYIWKWISFDESCNNIFVFWNYIIEALSFILGDSRETFLDFFHANVNTKNITEMLYPFINALSENGEIFIVLDDFHWIKDQILLDSFSFFLDNSTENIHFILLTREEPLFYVAKYEMQGELVYIKENDLTLSNSEAIQFLKNTLELPYSDSTLSYMAEIADGWIGGLQLIAASTMGKAEEQIRHLTVTSHLIKEYLSKEIFEQLSDREQNFLILTCPLSYFNRQICEKLFPDLDFSEMIDQLTSKNLLIQCVDEIQGIYRYHNLFGEYLRTHFKKLPAADQRMILKSAANILRNIGDYDECLQHLLEIQDYSEAMDLILEMPQNLKTFSYYHKIPIEHSTQNFDFLYQRFFYHYSNLETDWCQKIYSAAKPLLETDKRYAAFIGTKLLFSDELLSFDFPVMTAAEIEALELAENTKALILVKNSAFLYYLDRFKDAMDCITHSQQYGKDQWNFYISYFNMTMQSQIHEELGNLQKALFIQKETLAMLKKAKIMDFLYPTHFITIVGIYLKQMKLESAKESLDACKPYLSDKVSQLHLSYDYNLAEYYYITGSVRESLQIIQQILDTKIYGNILLASGLIKYLYLADEMTPVFQDEFIKTYECAPKHDQGLNSTLLYARILIGRKQPAKALYVLDELLGYARKEEVKLKIIEATLLKLRILIGQTKETRQILHLYQEAVYYACENSGKLPFFLDKDIISALLKEYGSCITDTFSSKEKEFHQDIIRLCQPSSDNILSQREMDVLQALAEGMTNKEIGENLYISLATVKTHIINIYRKLEVGSRVSAVDEARKLGIL